MRYIVVLLLALSAVFRWPGECRAQDCGDANQLTAEARQVVSRDAGLAEQKLREALQLCPDSAAIHYNLAILLYMTRQYDEAKTQLEASLTIAPDYPPSLNALAFLLLDRPQQRPRALELASQAVDLEVGNAEYLDTLTRIQALESIGRDGTARSGEGADPVVLLTPGGTDPGGVVLRGPGAASVIRYVAGSLESGTPPSLVAADQGTRAALVQTVSSGASEVYRLMGVGGDGLYVVVGARAPVSVPVPGAARARACQGNSTHQVQPGDTLSLIAQRHYGDPSLWEAIYTCNRAVIGTDSSLLTPGSTLVIP